MSGTAKEVSHKHAWTKGPLRQRNNSALPRMNSFHLRAEGIIVCFAIDACVYFTMAVGTKCDDVSRMVRTSVAHPADMVRLQVWSAILSVEGSFPLTSFAFPFCASENEIPNVNAPLINGALPHTRCLLIYRGGRQGPPKKFLKIDANFLCRIFFDRFDYSFQRSKLEDDSLSLSTVITRGRFPAVGFAYHLVNKLKPTLHHLEEKQTLAVYRVLRDGFVTPVERHVSGLAFAKILEYAIVAKAIIVTVLLAGLASNDENDGEVLRSNDPTSLLALKPAVDIALSIVNSSFFESKTHAIPLPKSAGYEPVHPDARGLKKPAVDFSPVEALL